MDLGKPQPEIVAIQSAARELAEAVREGTVFMVKPRRHLTSRWASNHDRRRAQSNARILTALAEFDRITKEQGSTLG